MIGERTLPNHIAFNSKSRHQPVLLSEVIKGLDPKEGETVLDCTVNGGGHSRKIALLIGPKGRLIGLDEDRSALEESPGESLRLPGQHISRRIEFSQSGQGSLQARHQRSEQGSF